MSNIVNVIRELTDQIRVYGDEDHPLFVAADVGNWLGNHNIRTTLSSFGGGEIDKVRVPTKGGRQLMVVLTLLRRTFVRE
jgi:prophage antirepressor-like protein